MTRKDQDTQASILLINFVDQMSILGILMSLFIDDRAVRVEEEINVGISIVLVFNKESMFRDPFDWSAFKGIFSNGQRVLICQFLFLISQTPYSSKRSNLVVDKLDQMRSIPTSITSSTLTARSSMKRLISKSVGLML